jgi:hypothetical protein
MLYPANEKGEEMAKAHSGKGLPNRKPSKLEAAEIAMTAADYNVTRRLMMSLKPYKGSPDEKEHKKWGKKK